MKLKKIKFKLEPEDEGLSEDELNKRKIDAIKALGILSKELTPKNLEATPEMPATMMGAVHVPLEEQLASTPVVVDLFQFMNGINGSGPMGFQAGIGAANPGDANYSPMWKISYRMERSFKGKL